MKKTMNDSKLSSQIDKHLAGLIEAGYTIEVDQQPDDAGLYRVTASKDGQSPLVGLGETQKNAVKALRIQGIAAGVR